MGLSDSWIIVRDTGKEALWDFFGLEEAEPSRNARYGYVDLPNGWSVVWDGEEGFSGRKELIAASKLGFALRLYLHDRTELLSTLTAADDGRPLWEVSIDDQEEVVLKGSPPLDAAGLYKLLDDFEGPMGDAYDIPPALAKKLSSFDVSDFFNNVRYLRLKRGARSVPSPVTREISAHTGPLISVARDGLVPTLLKFRKALGWAAAGMLFVWLMRW